MVEEGKFRQDLFFRLNVAQIALPPLRERRDDIPLLVEHFLAKLATAAGRRRAQAARSGGAGAARARYRWPGNVRELENEITRADALSGDRIGVADLSPQVAAAGDPGAVVPDDPDSLLLQAARRTPGAVAAARGAGPRRQQPDQGRRAPGPVALRPAEEAQAVQLQCLTGRPTQLPPRRARAIAIPRDLCPGARLAVALLVEAARGMNAPRRRRFKRLGRLATLLGALTLLWACNAPFIPVPPPGATFTAELVTDGAGAQKTVWITHGLPSSQASLARYYVFNETLGAGIIATAGTDGTFTGTPMDGADERPRSSSITRRPGATTATRSVSC